LNSESEWIVRLSSRVWYEVIPELLPYNSESGNSSHGQHNIFTVIAVVILNALLDTLNTSLSFFNPPFVILLSFINRWSSLPNWSVNLMNM
jgi:hypothetical protein